MSKNKKIAITGTIASGKSTLSNYLRSLNYEVFDCDEVNAELLKKDNEGYKGVKQAFPECFIDDELDKRKLSDIVFNDNDKKLILESIMHPLILNELLKCDNDILFAEVPLLFEVNWDRYFDSNVLVISNEDIVIERLLARGLNIAEIDSRIKNQMSVKEKIKRADKIIYNNGSLADFYQEIDDWLKEIL